MFAWGCTHLKLGGGSDRPFVFRVAGSGPPVLVVRVLKIIEPEPVKLHPPNRVDHFAFGGSFGHFKTLEEV
jgi:hypothetical protein